MRTLASRMVTSGPKSTSARETQELRYHLPNVWILGGIFVRFFEVRLYFRAPCAKHLHGDERAQVPIDNDINELSCLFRHQKFSCATSNLKTKINLTINLFFGYMCPEPKFWPTNAGSLRGVRVCTPLRVPVPERAAIGFTGFQDRSAINIRSGVSVLDQN